MVIAVSTGFIGSERIEESSHFIENIFNQIALDHPTDSFIFFSNSLADKEIIYNKNVTTVVVPIRSKSLLAIKWWYDVKITSALKKYKADVFVSSGSICSLTTKVPQVMIVDDLIFLYSPKSISSTLLFFYKRYVPKFLKKATSIATLSAFSKQDMLKKYKVSEEKLVNIGGAAREIFQPLQWDEKLAVKEKFTDECEYFLFLGTGHPQNNLLNLLKAFSLFKIRQHSNMKLLITNSTILNDTTIIEKLETYKFRKEVKIISVAEETELAKIVASAYAFVYPGINEFNAIPVIEAMQAGVPVIASNTGPLIEAGGEAALYADSNDPNAIAEQLKLVYKDEQLRSKMIEQGKQQSAKFTLSKTTALMWQAIELAVSN